MNGFRGGIGLCLVSLLFINTSNAFDGETRGLKETSQAAMGVVDLLKQGHTEGPANEALSLLVRDGLQAVKDSGDAKLASKLEKEWAGTYEPNLTLLLTAAASGIEDLAILDLGDHPPLFAWLNQFYEILNKKTMGIIKSIRIIEDIRILNFALPVVFSPKGKWKLNDGRDWVEYRKHFIPFANIAIYWIAKKVCDRVVVGLPGLVKRLCGPVVNKIEWYMGRHLAPKISDWIYNVANRTHASGLELELGDLPLWTLEELENEILPESALTDADLLVGGAS